SASASITIADTTPPTTPTGLTAAAVGSTGANLSWSASTDNVAVTGYIVRRNGTQVATPATTSFADTGLSSDTPHSTPGPARHPRGRQRPPQFDEPQHHDLRCGRAGSGGSTGNGCVCTQGCGDDCRVGVRRKSPGSSTGLGRRLGYERLG